MENIILFTSIPDYEWKDEFLTRGIGIDDVSHQAGGVPVILVKGAPFYEDFEGSFEVKFSKPKNEVYPDPDVPDEEREESGSNYWGYYVLDIRPEEIIEVVPSGYLIAKNAETGETEEFPFVGENYIRNKELPEDQRVWTEEMQSFSKVNLNMKKVEDNNG